VQAFAAAAEQDDGSLRLIAAERERPDAVHVLTAHAAVGREFDTVIVVGSEEGDFPSLARPEPMFDLAGLERSLTRSERNRARLADERRLFRMVVARAVRRVVFTACDPRGPESVLTARSRFVDEMKVPWTRIEAEPVEPISVKEATAGWRRTLGSREAPAPERLSALDGLLALGVDPGQWWFLRDWTGSDRPLHETIRVSASRLETLENCGLQFVLREELGLARPAGYHAWVGKLVHKLIEDCEKGLVERTLQALVAEVDLRWQPRQFPSTAVSDAFRKLVVDNMLPNWFDEFAGQPSFAAEIPFSFDFDGAVVSGRIDRIGHITAGGNKIIDFKTGKPEKAGKAEENLQLGVYYLAAHEADELAEYRPVRGVELVFLRGNWRTGKLERRAWQVGENSVNDERYQSDMRDRLTGLIERIRQLLQTERYQPSTSADCFGCDFKTLCPLWPEGRELFPVEAQT
jgi:RecB family exonuclease